MPKLSIVTICKNEKDRIQQTIESVLHQTFTDYQYIVIDGSSTDGTIEIINDYADQIDLFITEPDRGIYNAMNKGLQYAEGKYIYFLNGGDYLYSSDVFERVFSYNLTADIIYGYILSTVNGENRVIKAKEKITKEYLFNRTLPHSATITKKRIFSLTNDFDESYKISGDYDFFLQAILKYKATTRYVPILFAYFNPDGISTNDPKLRSIETRRAILNNFSSSFLFIARYLPWLIFEKRPLNRI